MPKRSHAVRVGVDQAVHPVLDDRDHLGGRERYDHHERRTVAALDVMQAHALHFDELSGRRTGALRLPGALVHESRGGERRRRADLKPGAGTHEPTA